MTENGLASVQTLSMLSLGRLMVMLQTEAPPMFWLTVPPGHSAESKAPPVLLFTVKVYRLLWHLQMPPLQ